MQSGRNKGFIWLFVFLAVGALLLALAFRPTSIDKWEATKTRIDQLQLETISRKLPRSALRGKLNPGNAWDEYNLALNDAVPWDDDPNGALLARFLNGDAHVDRANVNRLLADHKQAIDHLHLGAQRSDGQYPYNWGRGMSMALPSLMKTRRLANLAVAQAKILAENGKPQDAANLLLDVSAFARDVSTNAPILSNLIGLAVYSITFDEFRNLILSGRLTRVQVADLAMKLETVDHDFPSLNSAFSNDTMLSSMSLLEASDSGLAGIGFRFREGGWSFAINPRGIMTRFFEEKDSYRQRSQKFDEMNFAAAKKEADAIYAEALASTNTLVRIAVPSLSKMILAYRGPLARLRLVRAGTTFLATGEMPTLADPFGDKLLYKPEGGKLKIWSIGDDGTNQNGVGNWQQGRPDMVIEISK